MSNLKRFFRGKKVFITGHTGFKGSWLTKILLDWGADVAGMALEPKTIPNLFDSLDIKDSIKNYFQDINNFEGVKEIIAKERPEIVFHLAAQAILRESYDNPLLTFSTNIMGTANLLQAIKEADFVRSVVVITSDKVYQDKQTDHHYQESDQLGGYDPYSASKAAADIVSGAYFKSFFSPNGFNNYDGTFVAIARAGNVIGGGDWGADRLIPDIIKAIYERNEKVIIRNPGSIRPWLYVMDVLRGYLLLARELYNRNEKAVGTWNFGPGSENFITVEEMVKRIITIFGKGEYEIIPDTIKHETSVLKLDASKAKNILNWVPKLTLDESLGFTLEWYKKYYENKKVAPEFTDKQIELFFNENEMQSL